MNESFTFDSDPFGMAMATRATRAEAQRAELLAALKAMVGLYHGVRGSLTSPPVIATLAAADIAIANAEAQP